MRPPPYSPAGISPENSRYSMGWSSVRTASRTVSGSVGSPLGTAQDASTPSRSRRTPPARPAAGRGGLGVRPGGGLRGARRVALAAVLLQRHGPTVVGVTGVLPQPG